MPEENEQRLGEGPEFENKKFPQISRLQIPGVWGRAVVEGFSGPHPHTIRWNAAGPQRGRPPQELKNGPTDPCTSSTTVQSRLILEPTSDQYSGSAACRSRQSQARPRCAQIDPRPRSLLEPDCEEAAKSKNPRLRVTAARHKAP